MTFKTYAEVIPNPAEGIFYALNSFDVPWKNNNYYVPDDMDYTLNHAADKYISRMVDILLNSNEELSSNALSILANVIYKMFSRKWTKLYASFNFEYNPINNYDMTETMTNDTTQHTHGHTETITDNLTHTKTGTETTEYDTTDETTNDLNNTIEEQIEGFNSSSYQPANKSIADNTGTQTVTKDGTDTLTHNTTNRDTGTQTHANTGTDTDVRNYVLTRSGNIGVTTSQQMIESERKLWEYDFVMSVYRDIDRILTIEYYGGF